MCKPEKIELQWAVDYLYQNIKTNNMKFIQIQHTGKGKNEILKNKKYTEFINIKQISSFSEVKPYTLLSGERVGEYAELSMNNGDRLFLTKSSQKKLLSQINKISQY